MPATLGSFSVCFGKLMHHPNTRNLPFANLNQQRVINIVGTRHCTPYGEDLIRRFITDQCILGTIDITDFVPLHSRGEVGIAVHKDYRQQGYATDALKLLCEYAFDFLSLSQLYAHVTTDNDVCVKLFTSCGFVQCGLLKNWLQVEGCYKDALLLQCLNPKK